MRNIKKKLYERSRLKFQQNADTTISYQIFRIIPLSCSELFHALAIPLVFFWFFFNVWWNPLTLKRNIWQKEWKNLRTRDEIESNFTISHLLHPMCKYGQGHRVTDSLDSLAILHCHLCDEMIFTVLSRNPKKKNYWRTNRVGTKWAIDRVCIVRVSVRCIRPLADLIIIFVAFDALYRFDLFNSHNSHLKHTTEYGCYRDTQ